MLLKLPRAYCWPRTRRGTRQTHDCIENTFLAGERNDRTEAVTPAHGLRGNQTGLGRLQPMTGHLRGMRWAEIRTTDNVRFRLKVTAATVNAKVWPMAWPRISLCRDWVLVTATPLAEVLKQDWRLYNYGY